MTPPPEMQASPAVPPPPRKGRGPLFWILSGCLVLVVLGGLAVGIPSYLLYQRAKRAGFDTELARRNPALAAAKLVIAANPDLEIVSVDEEAGRMTIRDRRKNKTVTLDVDQVRQGRIVFDSSEGRVEVGSSQDGVTVRSNQGEIRLGGSTKAPSWVPTYPGAKQTSIMTNTSNSGEGGMVTLEVSDAPAKVADHLEAELKKGGFDVTRTNLNDQVITLTATHTDGRSISAQASRADSTTNVSLTYEKK